ncbi:hypothetical protein TRV_05946 [Trichophyton verrucosum HKI 0517]|uniref:Uncharacterized protein n=1 Tax=Trichophyton verrucosum (strain HKI 0517) TaxID=663202 RepID=D4DFJ5_TRIVH|nr:uncharacterized protein TRV_05946 [Trichophyton verrucosum HKI 0517]EFE39353.1 hypothetical protein TRV_05946 [Trichophyton verrucosum HKI 0517]
MDVSQLPDISGHLVTPDNPARDPAEGMDVDRCVALHNYLVHYAWLAQGRSLDLLRRNSYTYFAVYGGAAESLRPRLHWSLAAFLDAAILPLYHYHPSGVLFFYAHHFNGPAYLLDNITVDLKDMPEDSLVSLYEGGMNIESGGGLFYHQASHRAVVFMHMDAYDQALPIEEKKELWHPLETVLSSWINLIIIGKVVGSLPDEPGLFDCEKFGCWEWRPYSDIQVDTCIAAWDRLCEAIEARILRSTTGTTVNSNDNNNNRHDSKPPLVPPAVLDAASVPDPGFARAFLTRARRPLFHCIAPGLVLPAMDKAGFVAEQPYTSLPRSSSYSIPPVCLFPAAGEHPVHLNSTTCPFTHDFSASYTHSNIPPRVNAGVYSESVMRNSSDKAEEGFRLLLPFNFMERDWEETGLGARKSDGSLVGNMGALFQHGYKPFGGGDWRPRRLECLFNCWRKLIDDDIWSVGPNGVNGTLDTFREADGERWRHYYISPSW